MPANQLTSWPTSTEPIRLPTPVSLPSTLRIPVVISLDEQGAVSAVEVLDSDRLPPTLPTELQRAIGLIHFTPGAVDGAPVKCDAPFFALLDGQQVQLMQRAPG